jgi:uncharacterized membrane protein (DUF2068 family)
MFDINKFAAIFGIVLAIVFFPLFVYGIITHNEGFIVPMVITIFVFIPSWVMEIARRL